MYSPHVKTRTQTKSRPGGFTLVELLVVISIIAVLLTILLPALQAAKKQAEGVLCVAHLRALSMVYTMYADDNEGRLVWSLPDFPSYNPWVVMPIAADGTMLHRGSVSADGSGGDFPTLEDRLRGIRQGALFPYTDQNTDIYHCPSDKRMYNGTHYGSSAVHRLYRSYSIQFGLNGGYAQAPTRLSGISQPEETYVFVEEPGTGGCFNCNSGFILSPTSLPGSWWSVVANWHNASGTLGYADGHAERRVWVDERTRSLQYLEGWWDFESYQPDNRDLEYMFRNYGFKGDKNWMNW